MGDEGSIRLYQHPPMPVLGADTHGFIWLNYLPWKTLIHSIHGLYLHSIHRLFWLSFQRPCHLPCPPYILFPSGLPLSLIWLGEHWPVCQTHLSSLVSFLKYIVETYLSLSKFIYTLQDREKKILSEWNFILETYCGLLERNAPQVRI